MLQLSLFDAPVPSISISPLEAVRLLCQYHKQGLLGGEVMPEDANPNLEKSSKDNFHYFTLPMALNYQRNSYTLWKSALKTYQDQETRFVFYPEKVVITPEDTLRAALLKYKVALQPNKHIQIWKTLCETFMSQYNGDARNLILNLRYVPEILQEIQVRNKKSFPYLSGNKLANYWLYVVLQYTDLDLSGKGSLSVVPDTHIIQSSIKLGVIESGEELNVLRSRTVKAWQAILQDSEFDPIDIHTPLWLWSRRGFTPDVEESQKR